METGEILISLIGRMTHFQICHGDGRIILASLAEAPVMAGESD
jgi:hypothetical protein